MNMYFVGIDNNFKYHAHPNSLVVWQNKKN